MRAADSEDDEPGSGTMLALVRAHEDPNREPTEVPLPLQHTDVHAVVTGYIGTVDVTQQFENPYDEKIEAVYVFPLPEKAAVNEFVMTIGDRKIRGILREKEEAEQIYEDARAQGYRASLLVQHRPNIFEQKVANIEPGKRIDVNIRYFHTLAYEDGWYSFVFPTVVGPRYNPIGSKDPVAALPREDVAEPAAGTAVRYLRPSERSAHDIGISVDVDAGVAIEELVASHEIKTDARRCGARARRAREREHDPEPRLHPAIPRSRRHDQVEPVDLHGPGDPAGLFHADDLSAHGGGRSRAACRSRWCS